MSEPQPEFQSFPQRTHDIVQSRSEPGWSGPRSGRHRAPRRRRRETRLISAAVAFVVVVAVGAAVAVRLSRGSTANAAGPVVSTPPQSPTLSQRATPSPPAAPSQPAAPPSSDATDADAGRISPTTPVTPAIGTQVYSDDFRDPLSGWITGTHDFGTRGKVVYSYGTNGYTVEADGASHFFAYTPYSMPAPQVVMSATATESAGAPPTGGFGVTCRRDVGAPSEIHYEFLVNQTRRWFVERHDGIPSQGHQSVLLDEGGAPARPSAKPMTLVAICASFGDGRNTRLVLFVNGDKVADLEDSAVTVGMGWTTGLLGAGGQGASTQLRFTRFVVARIGGPATSDQTFSGDDPPASSGGIRA